MAEPTPERVARILDEANRMFGEGLADPATCEHRKVDPITEEWKKKGDVIPFRCARCGTVFRPREV